MPKQEATPRPARKLPKTYTMQFACFDCRKVFKRSLPYFPTPAQSARIHSCPQCGRNLQPMGRAFRAPRHDDRRGWRRVASIIQQGFTFHPNQGALPANSAELKAHLAERRQRSKGERLAEQIKNRHD